MKHSKIRFNADSLRKALLKNLTEEQTNRLIAYAQEEIMSIGNTINSYASRNHMDRTGNLLDSLCWGVAYRGDLKASGFYREKTATQGSTLHEWFKAQTRPKDAPHSDRWLKLDASMLPEIDGHALAEHYLATFGKKYSENGWRVFFAVLAPYWGFWEKGFTLRHFGGGSSFMKFAVMSQFYDQVKHDLKPARVGLSITNISYTNTSVAKQAKRGFYKS